jgi:tetratricopeptide (TPR) repeat protein
MNTALSKALKKVQDSYRSDNKMSAVQQCRKLIKRFSKDAEPYIFLATIYQSEGKVALALDVLESAYKKMPKNLSLKLRYGDMCMRAGQYIRASKVYRGGVKEQPEQLAWSLRLAVALQESQQTIDEAIEIYKNLIAQQPNDAALYYNLGTALKRQHKFDETVDAYRKAVAYAPDDTQYRMSLCNLYFEMTRFDEAVIEGEELIKRNKNMPEVLGILYYAHKKLANYTESLQFAERLVDVDEGSADSMIALASAQIAVKKYANAIETCSIALEKAPTNRRVLADQSIALSFDKKIKEARHIFDVDKLLNITTVNTPSGYESIESFNQAIIDHVERHPTIRFDGLNHTCLGGTTSDEIFVSPMGPVEQLKNEILSAVNQYRHALVFDESHPWLANLPEQMQLNLSGWVTRLRAQGYQQGHIHPTAWISGVYYVNLPPISKETPEAGGIEFGRAPSYYPDGDQGATKIVRPVGGTLVLFPSYFYHRTIPFDADTERFTLAFDFRKSDFT